VLQSLALLNDAFMLEQAAAFAGRVLKEAGPKPEQWIERSYRIALGRAPSPEETGWSLETLHRVQDRYQSSGKPADEARRRALAAVCHTLLNTNEFLYVE
jgi:hypothetical protein